MDATRTYVRFDCGMYTYIYIYIVPAFGASGSCQIYCHAKEHRDLSLTYTLPLPPTAVQTWAFRGNGTAESRDTLRDMIWRQLNAGGSVWLTGHSKGGAVATTASSRLLFGDSVNDANLPDEAVRRPNDNMLTVRSGSLSRLSVTTFNAPKAFKSEPAAMYDIASAKVGSKHVRVEHQADLVRNFPLFGGTKHVGDAHREG